MVAIGVTHFAWAEPFLRIMPDALPFPLALVYLSGGFEITCGLGLLHPRTRTVAAWGLVLLYLAVFPANVNMAINEIQLTADGTLPVWTLWARLPLQLGFIAVAYWITRPDADA